MAYRLNGIPKKVKGIYVLVLKLEENQQVCAGKLPPALFQPGVYMYVGRAKNGLKARLDRHLRKEKKIFWHIDYLLQKAEIQDIWIRAGFFDECGMVYQLKKALNASFFPLKNFGSSDCLCPSHLLFIPDKSADFSPLKKFSFKRIIPDGVQA